ncbi:MAG: hypothetical protein OQK50_03445 [Deltaproteobacteria bacterium]|jgi:hypothetical protein|nr:hypothetical protein [Deltaproteobacteria bacterium]MCW8893389.1 hypothetical protein [Deltaproteobacteria bacterium]MCW9049369.1 hypothetical protein [Deltaproteobacteria bacterium]
MYSEASNKGFYGTFEEYYATLTSTKATELAAAAVTSKSAFLLSITTSDVGCGGTHNGTAYALIDFLPESSGRLCPLKKIQC